MIVFSSSCVIHTHQLFRQSIILGSQHGFFGCCLAHFLVQGGNGGRTIVMMMIGRAASRSLWLLCLLLLSRWWIFRLCIVIIVVVAGGVFDPPRCSLHSFPHGDDQRRIVAVESTLLMTVD